MCISQIIELLFYGLFQLTTFWVRFIYYPLISLNPALWSMLIVSLKNKKTFVQEL